MSTHRKKEEDTAKYKATGESLGCNSLAQIPVVTFDLAAEPKTESLENT
jgi:hypothetical protein